MDSRIREALLKIANGDGILEDVSNVKPRLAKIANEALAILTAELEPCENTTDDILWQEIFSLREQLKIAAMIIKGYDPSTDEKTFLASLGHQDFQEYLEYVKDSQIDASQVADKLAKELRAQVSRLRDELDYSERRLTTSYQASQSLREEVARLKELLEEYRQELMTGKKDLAATEPKGKGEAN